MFQEVTIVDTEHRLPITANIPSQVVEQSALLGSVCGTRGQTGGGWRSNGPAWTTASGSPSQSPVGNHQNSGRSFRMGQANVLQRSAVTRRIRIQLLPCQLALKSPPSKMVVKLELPKGGKSMERHGFSGWNDTDKHFGTLALPVRAPWQAYMLVMQKKSKLQEGCRDPWPGNGQHSLKNATIKYSLQEMGGRRLLSEVCSPAALPLRRLQVKEFLF